MKSRWLLIGTVVGVAVLIDLVVIPWSERWFLTAYWFEITMFSIAPTHGSLLAVWAALGGKATPWRLVAALVAAAAWIWIEHTSLSRSEMAFWVAILSMQMVALSVLLSIARLWGLELGDDLRGATVPEIAPGSQWVQFSLRSLLSWTTALAVVFGLLHYVPKQLLWDIFREPAALLALAATLFGSVVIALGAFWVALGARWPAVRIITLALTAAAAVTTLRLLLGPAELWGFLLFYLMQAAYLVGSLWLVRLAGYRLVWRRRTRL